MHHLTDLLFRTLFDQLPEPRIILRPDSPDFTVVIVNRAYAEATKYTPEQLTGRSFWELFKADAAGSSSAETFRQGLADVLRHRTHIKLPIFRFDVLVAGKASPRWWQVEILPVMDERGEITYLSCTTHNVTIHIQDQAAILQGRHSEAAMLVQQQHAERELTEAEKALRESQDDLAAVRRHTDEQVSFRTKELSDSEYRLKRIIANTPAGLCILKGDDFIIDVINQPLLNIWGRKADDVIGKPLLTVVPEFIGQPFPKLLKQVLRTGKKVTMPEEAVIILQPDGTPKDAFADFSYDPLFDVNQQVEAVLVTVNEITEMVKARKLLQDRQDELEAMNEEMTAANEELQAMNEELTTASEELTEANRQLQDAQRRQNSLEDSSK
jgi:PAS domain S-box-containing protein